ncbi:helix-turn-helix domain-containing protein, partial [Paenibacillus tyrfis]
MCYNCHGITKGGKSLLLHHKAFRFRIYPTEEQTTL